MPGIGAEWLIDANSRAKKKSRGGLQVGSEFYAKQRTTLRSYGAAAKPEHGPKPGRIQKREQPKERSLRWDLYVLGNISPYRLVKTGRQAGLWPKGAPKAGLVRFAFGA